MKGAPDRGDPPAPGRVAIVGVGNVLMGDDGVGPFIVRQLEARFHWPDEVTITDAGTPGGDLLSLIEGAEVLFVLDTARAQASPGTVCMYARHQLLAAPVRVRLSPHAPGLLEALQVLEFRGTCPSDVTLIGVAPKACEFGAGLSELAKRAADQVIAIVTELLARRGVRFTRRDQPLPPDICWEDGAGAGGSSK